MTWTLEQDAKWPFRYSIKDETGAEVIGQEICAWSSNAKTAADAMQGHGFRGASREAAIKANQDQLTNLRLIAAAPELLEALKGLVEANEAVQDVLCDGPEVPGFDPSALGKAQMAVTEAEKVALKIILKAESSS